MAWVYLFFAGLFEVGWAIGLKYTAGFTARWASGSDRRVAGVPWSFYLAPVRGHAMAIYDILGIGLVPSVSRTLRISVVRLKLHNEGF